MPYKYRPMICTKCSANYMGRCRSRFCSKRCAKTQPFSERFWSKVNKGPSCWTWTASTFPEGYGCFVVTTDGKTTHVGAHRVSFEMHNGPIADGMEVCHSCDNPACVRPEHLFLGTHLQNMYDSIRKGRMGRLKNQDKIIETHGTNFLEKVFSMRSSGMSQKAIARNIGVCNATVHNWLRGDRSRDKSF